MRNGEKNAFLLKSYPFYMKYKQNLLFGGHFGRHLEFQYEKSTFRLDTQAKKFANCITVNIQPSNLFSGGGGTKLFFCRIGFCTIGHVTLNIFTNSRSLFQGMLYMKVDSEWPSGFIEEDI